ncbi:hypothetical protein GCM10027342_32020 [Photobacterium alginatilyticum]
MISNMIVLSGTQAKFDSELDDHYLNWDVIEQWDTSLNKRDKATWLGISIRISI